MIVQCPACNARYRIRDANIPASGGKIRCPSCGHSFVVYPEVKKPSLSEMASSMASDDGATAVVSGADVAKLQQYQALKEDLADSVGDGTVEIKNPMEFWEQLQKERGLGKKPAPAAAPLPAAAPFPAASEEHSDAYDEDDASPTEVVSAANLSFPFPSKPQAPASGPKPSIPSPYSTPDPVGAPTMPLQAVGGPSTVPTPAVGGYSAPDPGFSAPPVSKPSGLPTPAFPSSPNTPAQGSPHTPAPYAPMSTQGQAQVPASQGGYGVQASGGGFAPAAPQGGFTPQAPLGAPSAPNLMGGTTPGFGPPMGAPATSSSDILAAIEEVSAAHDDGPSPGQQGDPNHAGPWKLKTNFGLTYEFPDTASLSSWLSSRDELDGYMLSATGDVFLELDAFPQLKRSESAPSRRMASSGFNSNANPPAAQPGMPQNPFTAPPASGSGQFTPMASAAQGERVTNTEYRPPSRNAKGNKILWLVFFFLLLTCGAIAVQTFGVFDIIGLVNGGPTEAAPVVEKAPVVDEKAHEQAAAEESDEDGDAEEIERVLKKVRRAFKANRLPAALDSLETVEMLDPNRIELHEMKAKIYKEMGQEEDAARAEKKVEELKSASKDVDSKEEVKKEDGDVKPAEDVKDGAKNGTDKKP